MGSLIFSLGLLKGDSRQCGPFSASWSANLAPAFFPVLLWLQVSFYRVSSAPGAQLAPSLEASFLPRAPWWACLSPKALFLRVFTTPELQSIGPLMCLHLFQHLFISFLYHLLMHHFHLLSRPQGSLSASCLSTWQRSLEEKESGHCALQMYMKLAESKVEKQDYFL